MERTSGEVKFFEKVSPKEFKNENKREIYELRPFVCNEKLNYHYVRIFALGLDRLLGSLVQTTSLEEFAISSVHITFRLESDSIVARFMTSAVIASYQVTLYQYDSSNESYITTEKGAITNSHEFKLQLFRHHLRVGSKVSVFVQFLDETGNALHLGVGGDLVYLNSPETITVTTHYQSNWAFKSINIFWPPSFISIWFPIIE